MKVYIAATRTRRLIARFQELGWGMMHSPTTDPRGPEPKLRPWAWDNGAFGAWASGRPWDEAKWLESLAMIEGMPPPAFLVLPDEVGAGARSLALSLSWMERIPRPDWYLAVQDGMTSATIPWAAPFGGLFVGGTTDWKMETFPAWIRAAHDHGRPCHVARMGTPRKVRLARWWGADSVDSSFPLWTRDRMAEFVGAASGHDGQQLLPTADEPSA